MGLLDEAIREHLELKRRRGADSDEISRQEHEAFGAARRGDVEVAHAPVDEHHDVEPALDHPAEFAAEEAPTTLHAVEEPPVEELEPPRPHGDPADALPHAVDHHHDHDHDLAEPPRPHGDPADHLPHVEEAPVQEHRVVEPEPEPAPPAAPPVSAGQPTREFDPDEVRAATGEELSSTEDAVTAEDDEGDVLEETPEFLQETPEHDRLWFEQRPPRDFDF
jgi:hypothetical protein